MPSAVGWPALPLVQWPEILTFGDAVRFQGERPWLGILFWTTFSTSVMFYLFVVATATAHAAPLAQATRRIIDVEREPVVGLAASSITVVTLVYIVGSGGTALYNVLR